LAFKLQEKEKRFTLEAQSNKRQKAQSVEPLKNSKLFFASFGFSFSLRLCVKLLVPFPLPSV
jgi:hypothetical protein